MSRHSITKGQCDIVVGWDAGAGSYFGQIINLRATSEEEELLLWMGTSPCQFLMVEDFINEFSYRAAEVGIQVQLPPDLISELQLDKEFEGSLENDRF